MCLPLIDSAAQTVGAADGIGRAGFTLSDDMKAYEVICKEHPKEYGNYYQVVRNRIIQRLKINYYENFRDGDIDLSFVLNSNGTLARIDVDLDRSVNDKGLLRVAVLSLQQASPFPPFPSELSVQKIPFDLTISFKKQ